MSDEIVDTPMSDRQRAYRGEYRARVASWYHGWLHVAVIYAIGGATLYLCASNVAGVRWWEWPTVPVAVLLCNLFEWLLHRHVMHRPLRFPGLRAIYTRHTLMHHQFFTEQEMRFADHRDWRVTVFPPYALVIFILMSIPGALALGWLVSANVGWLLMCTTTAMYLVYELMHFSCHVGEGRFVRVCPFVNTIRRHHKAHHDQAIMMERNMNLTFPIADWLFGTSDLDRGLIGHLFNGYSTAHVKTTMRRTSRTPRGAAPTAPRPVRSSVDG